MNIRTLFSLWLLLTLCSGCALNKYYRFQPTPAELAATEARERYADTYNKNVPKGEPRIKAKDAPSYAVTISVTDKHILQYCNNVKTTLRQRMTVSRTLAESGSAFQVLTAAAAAAYGATAAGGPVTATTTEVMAGLSGASAATPQLAKVFGFGDRSDAFSQGVALIEAAEAQYYAAVLTEGGTAGQDKLTSAGAQLYASTAAALKLVEHALASRIPTIEDMQAARGIRVNQIQVEPARVALKVNDPNPFTVLVVDNGPVTGLATTDKDIVAVPNLAASASRFALTAGAKTGVARVSFINDKGGSGFMVVDVFLPVSATVGTSTLAVGATTQLTITPQSQATHISASPEGILDINPADGVGLVSSTITGKAKGQVKLTVTNDQGGTVQIPMVVQ